MPKTTHDETVYESGATTDPDDPDNAGATDPDLTDDEDELANAPDVGEPSDATLDSQTPDPAGKHNSELPSAEDA